MTNKYQLVNEIANDTLKEVTSSSENWTKFLNTASSNYKYDFNEQILIYAQKPDATACADIETWNKRLKRWVNRGARGITLISIENGRNILRHVFDISDTHSGINQELKLWEIKSSYENGLIETLENSFGNLEIKDNLAEAAISDIAEQELREIYSSVRNFEKNTNNINRTFVNNQKTNYYINENKNNEGRNYYERVDIQTNGRLSTLPQTKKMKQGRFSRMRENYLKENKKGLYEELMLDGKMEEHLGEIEKTAQKRLKQVIQSLAEKNKVNEEMKRTDQMGWVQAMNSIRNQAEEMIMKELIYN